MRILDKLIIITTILLLESCFLR